MVVEAVEDYGIHATVDTCLALIDGHVDYDLLPVPLTYLAGVHAVAKLGRGNLAQRNQEHWPRLWGVRALRYVWLEYAEPGVVFAVGDSFWRVRETAAKVVAQRGLHTSTVPLRRLLRDAEPRVRVAAVRALGAVGGREDLRMLGALDVTDPALRVAVDAAARRLRMAAEPAGRSPRTGDVR
jgi:HEAT repeat protein